MLLTALLPDGDTKALMCLMMDKQKVRGKKKQSHQLWFVPQWEKPLWAAHQSRGDMENTQETLCPFFPEAHQLHSLVQIYSYER